MAVGGEVVLGLDAGGPVEVHTRMANSQTLHCNVDILRMRKPQLGIQFLDHLDICHFLAI